jgi:hypothetical protein
MSTTDIDAIRVLLRQDLERIAAADACAAELHQALTACDDTFTERALNLAAELHTQETVASRSRQEFAARTELLAHVELGDTTVEDIIAIAAGPITPTASETGYSSGLPSTGTRPEMTASGQH